MILLYSTSSGIFDLISVFRRRAVHLQTLKKMIHAFYTEAMSRGDMDLYLLCL